MFLTIGSPTRISSLPASLPDIREARRKIDIAVIDDDPFQKAEPLRTNDFRITEIGADIASVDQVAIYPVVVCDIKGVGKKFGSRFEGAHVLAQIRKYYPDKYLIAFTGMTFDASYNAQLANADVSITKDSGTDLWISALDEALRCVCDPRKRWLRFRQHLLALGIDAYDLFALEKAYVESIQGSDFAKLSNASNSKYFTPEVRDLVLKFVASAAVNLIKTTISPAP